MKLTIKGRGKQQPFCPASRRCSQIVPWAWEFVLVFTLMFLDWKHKVPKPMMRAITIPRPLQMTLLTVYETLSEVKQSRRNKLEVGRAGSPPRWSMIKHQCQCFFSVLWQPLTAWCLGFFIRKRKGEGMDPKQRGFHKQYSPNDFMWADTVLSGYQDNTIYFFTCHNSLLLRFPVLVCTRNSWAQQ